MYCCWWLAGGFELVEKYSLTDKMVREYLPLQAPVRDPPTSICQDLVDHSSGISSLHTRRERLFGIGAVAIPRKV